MLMNKVVFLDVDRAVGAHRVADEEDVNGMVAMWNKGSCQAEIAKTYGVSVSTVKRYFRDRKEAEKISKQYEDRIKYLETELVKAKKGSD